MHRSYKYESPEGTWGLKLKKNISKCAILSHGLVIRSLEWDNPFSRIAIRSHELAIRSRSLELDNPFSRVASLSLQLHIFFLENVLSYWKEQFTYPWERIPNPWERMAQIDITINLWLFFLQIFIVFSGLS